MYVNSHTYPYEPSYVLNMTECTEAWLEVRDYDVTKDAAYPREWRHFLRPLAGIYRDMRSDQTTQNSIDPLHATS